MLDTIKIRLKGGYVSSKAYSNFTPEYERREYKDLSEDEKKSHKNISVRTYTLKKWLLDEYCPRVEIQERVNKDKEKLERRVFIECSVPKLIRENNLIEITEGSRDVFISMLNEKLYKVGVITKKEYIIKSEVTKLHTGKNIILPNKYSIYDIFQNLRITEMGKSYDLSEKKHVSNKNGKMKIQIRNSDEVMTHYTSSRSYVFYDKIRDMQKTKNKSTDKDKTDQEKILLEIHNLYHQEILRFEYRLTDEKSLRSEVNKFLSRSYDDTVELRDIFNQNLWEELVIGAWKRILNRPENQLGLKFDNDCPDNVLRSMIRATDDKKSAHGMNGLLISYGLANLANEYGMKHVKKEFGRVWSQKACGQRLNEKVSYAVDLMDGLQYPESIEYVDVHIKAFEQVTEKHLAELI